MTIYYEGTTFLTKKSTLHGSQDVTEAYDPDGDCVARFYGEWTLHQLKQAIELANRYYEMGLRAGASMKTIASLIAATALSGCAAGLLAAEVAAEAALILIEDSGEINIFLDLKDEDFLKGG